MKARRWRGVISGVLGLALMQPVPSAASTGNMRLIGSVAFPEGSDLDFSGSYAFAGSLDADGRGGVYVIDISDPSDPVVVSRFPCWGYQNDVAVYKQYLVLGMHDSGNAPGCAPVRKGGLRIVDVGDPAHPRQVAFLEVSSVFTDLQRRTAYQVGVPTIGTHTVTVVGETGYVYANPGGDASRSTGIVTRLLGDPITIVDMRDPLHPKIAARFRPPEISGCHDISVRRDRAYCAGSQQTQIWDITDPIHPVVLGKIENPLIHFSHSAVPSSDGKTLVIGDEETFAQVCLPDGSSPIGAFWFYDITNERAPMLRGYLGPVGLRRVQSTSTASLSLNWCTAHNFNMVPGRPWMVAASYIAGTSVIDFSDPSNPRALGWIRPRGAATWSSYFYRGAIYTTDIRRGFDVIDMDGLPD